MGQFSKAKGPIEGEWSVSGELGMSSGARGGRQGDGQEETLDVSSKQIWVWLGLQTLQGEPWPAGLEGAWSPCIALLLLGEAAAFHLSL